MNGQGSYGDRGLFDWPDPCRFAKLEPWVNDAVGVHEWRTLPRVGFASSPCALPEVVERESVDRPRRKAGPVSRTVAGIRP